MPAENVWIPNRRSAGNIKAMCSLYATERTFLTAHENARCGCIVNGSGLERHPFGGRVGRNATIKTLDASDVVDTAEEYVDNVLDIETGGGDDTVLLGELNNNGTRDTSAQFDVHADNIDVNLGDSNDTLRVSHLSGSLGFDGGDGYSDRLYHDDGQDIGSAIGTQGFEYIDGNLQQPPPHKHTATTGSTLKMQLSALAEPIQRMKTPAEDLPGCAIWRATHLLKLYMPPNGHS
jgi:hypothetical protein